MIGNVEEKREKITTLISPLFKMAFDFLKTV